MKKFVSDGICYKVVCKKRGEPRAYISAIVRDGAKCDYRPGRITRPPAKFFEHGFGLLVFSNPEDANDFAVHHNHILRCEYMVRMPLPTRRCAANTLTTFTVARLLRMLSGIGWHEDYWPRGTMMVEAVRPIKIMRKEE